MCYNVLQCVAIDPTENRVAAGDSTGRILIWSDFKDQVPNAQKAPPAVRAVPATSHVPNAAAQHKCSANSDMGSNNDSCGSAQQHAGGGQQQQSMSYSGSRVADTAGNAGIDGAIGRCHGECLARLQRSRAAVPVTTLHWHAHPVGTLCFSSNGTLILSGGEEAVLVGPPLI